MSPKTRAQKVERARTIGENKRSFIGRMIDRLKKASGASPVSNLETHKMFPVDFRRLAALRFKITAA